MLSSPIGDPASWTLSPVAAVEVPVPLRYGGSSLRAVEAVPRGGGTGKVSAPATGVLRSTEADGRVVIELQLNPFPNRRAIAALAGGAPTFYLWVPAGTPLAFADDQLAVAGEHLADAAEVMIAVARQDRAVVDPTLWATQLDAAAADPGFAAFAAALRVALAPRGGEPVLLLDHTGAPLTSGMFRVTSDVPGADPFELTLTPADAGDLEAAAARTHAGDPASPTSVWNGGATQLTVGPFPPGDPKRRPAQLARVEDGATAADEIAVTPAARHVAVTNLDDWFAPQYAKPLDATGAPLDPLPRYTRGNRVTTFVNGVELFEDLFPRLRDAVGPGNGFHLAGWAVRPRTKFVGRTLGDDPDAETAKEDLADDGTPVTLEQALEWIGSRGGRSCIVAAKFLNLEGTVTPATSLTLYFLMCLDLKLADLGVAAARTDSAGVVVLIVAWIGATAYVAYVVGEDGKPLEPNRKAVEYLGKLPNTICVYSAHPGTIDDYGVPAPHDDFPFDQLFALAHRFGIAHQKLAVVRTPAGLFGYCGGVDLNDDRLDDADHLARNPFHDVHALVQGKGAGDLARTFEERWSRDGGGAQLAFPSGDATAPGSDVVQIARTYFRARVPARGLSFASNGDRTIADTMLAAIRSARDTIYIEDQYFTAPEEYRDALVAAVGSVRQLVVCLPGITDQPFGDAYRGKFVSDLLAADGGAGKVRIGYPRRRPIAPDNDIRSSSGKCVLMEDLADAPGGMETIAIGPSARVPMPPFWVCVEGELIYVYDEDSTIGPPPDPKGPRRMQCLRGAATRLVKGGVTSQGARARAHREGAAATVVDLTNIYVHSKLIIVDDVFLGLGSANLNRRGFYWDAEVNAFTIPEGLRTAARNPALELRRRLWAEMLDLPAELAAPLLTDPMGAAALWDRSPFAGNRFVPLDARPDQLLLGFGYGDGALLNGLKALGFTIAATNATALFENVVDPASETEVNP